MTIPSWACAGASIMCVDDKFISRRSGIVLPCEGVVYTVRDVWDRIDGRGVQIQLTEIINPVIGYFGNQTGEWQYGEPWFPLRRFAPLQHEPLTSSGIMEEA